MINVPKSKADLAPPYPHTCDTVFPANITEEINTLLSLASNMHLIGAEMRMCFISIDAAGVMGFMDCSEVPEEAVPAWVMMNADSHKAVVLVGCFEGWSLPDEDLRDYRKPGGYQGQIKDHPNAFEILMVTVETVKGTWLGKMRIPPKPVPREDIQNYPIHLGKTEVGGRFMHLLPANRGKKEDLLHVMERARERIEKDHPEVVDRHKAEQAAAKEAEANDKPFFH